ncbi:primosomal protein N' [bacterium]|nr:primosomal protein N' [bacterium]MBT4598061.1 primosomal protein N' [bacterium]MBT7431653.1 primosomal protein N' [bacterium]
MNYFDVIPLTKVARNKPQFFTYSNNIEIAIGTLVEINFGRKKITGIVAKKTTRPTFKTRPISKVISYGFLTPRQIKLARQISVYYLTSLGVVTKQFVPKFAKKETPCFVKQSKSEKDQKKIKHTKEQKSVIGEIKHGNATKPFLLFGPACAGKTEVAMTTMQEMLKEKKQSLLIIPEIFLSNQEIIRYKKRFSGKNILFFHSKLKSTEVTFALNQIKEGSADIIISTRIGLFLPFKNLGLIIVDEEQDISHKQWDSSPRYHARTVVEMMTKIYKTKTIFISSTPSMESVKKSLDGKYYFLELPRLKIKGFQVIEPEFILPDLRKIYTKRGEIPFSEELETELAKTLKRKGLSFVLIPRRGKSKLIYCTDCKKKLQCPSCNLPLVHEKNNYKCLHCSFKTSNLTQCPSCKSFRLKDIGFGTEGVASFLKKHYPSARIELIDGTIFEKISDRKILFQKLQNNKLDILVGTYAIAKGFDLLNVELTATINVDNWAGQTDFRFDERWVGNLFQLAGRLNRVNSKRNGKCIIQTYDPASELLETVQKQNWLEFAKEELETRKAFSYPPFSYIIRLTLKQPNEATLAKKTRVTYNKLSTNFRNSKTLVQPPYFATIKKVRGRWEKHILLKTTSFTSETWKSISNIVPDEWIIDVDSESIF